MQFLNRILTWLLLIAVLIFGVLFTIQNTATAPLDLLIIQLPEQRIVLWILSAFSIGGVIGMLMSSIAVLKLKSDKLLAQRELKRRVLEVEKLRSPERLAAAITTGENTPLNPRV